MKTEISLLALAFIIFFSSCQSSSPNEPDFSKVKIASISELGKIEYENQQIKSIAYEIFSWDEKNQLVESTIHRMDSSYAYPINPETDSQSLITTEFLQKCSYVYENKYPRYKMLDSLLEQTARDDTLISMSRKTGLLAEEYFYSDDKLDSIEFHNPTGDNTLKKLIYEYDDYGNISRQIEFRFRDLLWSPSLWRLEKLNIEFTDYDNKPNPFHILYNQAGFIPEKMHGKNFSKNNPLGSKITVIRNGTEMVLNNTYDYNYNSNGLPFEIILNKGSDGEKLIRISYY
jgi:hypothetical protein